MDEVISWGTKCKPSLWNRLRLVYLKSVKGRLTAAVKIIMSNRDNLDGVLAAIAAPQFVINL